MIISEVNAQEINTSTDEQATCASLAAVLADMRFRPGIAMAHVYQLVDDITLSGAQSCLGLYRAGGTAKPSVAMLTGMFD